jgi:hypothetical protein
MKNFEKLYYAALVKRRGSGLSNRAQSVLRVILTSLLVPHQPALMTKKRKHLSPQTERLTAANPKTSYTE